MHQQYRGTIIRWVDGDTVEIYGWKEFVLLNTVVFGVHLHVSLKAAKPEIYRLTTVDTPERGQPGYHEAWDYVIKTLPPGITVDFITHGEDDGGFGRTLCDVLIPGQGTTTISSLLLRDGYAKVWTPR